MVLVLTAAEREILQEMLERALTELRVELNHTDSRAFRARLRQRAQIVEDLAERLRRDVASAGEARAG
jgi:nicotinamide riboside kinase